MNYKKFIVCVLSLLLFATFAQAAPLAPKSKTKSASTQAFDAEFKQMIARYYDAWNTGNPESAAPFYAKDAGLVFYDLAPLKYNGWEEYKQGVQKNLFDNMTEGKLTPNDDLKVSRRGSVAWTTLTYHYDLKMKEGKSYVGDGRHTAIWEKRGGKWLIVHEQLSAPLQ